MWPPASPTHLWENKVENNRANYRHLFRESYRHTQANSLVIIPELLLPVVVNPHEAAEMTFGVEGGGIHRRPRGRQSGVLKARYCISNSHSLVELRH